MSISFQQVILLVEDDTLRPLNKRKNNETHALVETQLPRLIRLPRLPRRLLHLRQLRPRIRRNHESSTLVDTRLHRHHLPRHHLHRPQPGWDLSIDRCLQPLE